MSVTAASLRELHQIHQQLADDRDRVERGPLQIRAHEGNLTKLVEQLEETQERHRQTQLTIDRKQLDLKSGEQKALDLQVKLNGASNNKEYQLLLEQIAAAEMAGSVLADEILEAMEKLDSLAETVKEAEGMVAAGKKEFAETRKSIESAGVVLREDIAKLETRLAEAERALTSDFTTDYQRVVRGKGANGMASVEDGVCSGCGQQITLNMQNELMLLRPIFCKSCGCLLYLS